MPWVSNTSLVGSGVTYTQSQIIAADFNQSGDVTSADAYDILKYSVFGAEPGGAASGSCG